MALLAGLPTTVPGFAVDHVRRSVDGDHRRRPGKSRWAPPMWSVSSAESSTWVTTDGRRRRLQPALRGRAAHRRVGCCHGTDGRDLHDAFPQLTKEAADTYAVESQRRAGKAWDDGVMDEIIPMSVFTDDGWTVADRDQFLRPDTTMEALATLRTPFRAGGRVTAGNSAGLTDGAHRRAHLIGVGSGRPRPRAEDATRRLRVCRCRAAPDGASAPSRPRRRCSLAQG